MIFEGFDKETSVIIIIVGFMFFVGGILLLNDRAIIIGGNLIILFGYFSLFKSNPSYFFTKEKMYGSSFLFVGIISLMLKFLALGILLELIGMFLLFKSSLPSFHKLFTAILFRKPIGGIVR